MAAQLNSYTQNDVTLIIRDGNTYIGMRLTDRDINDLYDLLKTLSTTNYFIPRPITRSPILIHEGYVIPIYCSRPTPVKDLPSSWFFVYVTNLERTGKVPLYGTIQFKKFVYNLFRVARLFRTEKICPVFQLGKIFVDNDNEIIFSEYKWTAWARPYEIRSDVEALLVEIFTQKGLESETLNFEMSLLRDWVNKNLVNSTVPIENSLDESFFWTPSMRNDFITDMDNVDLAVEGKNIYQQSGDAFLRGDSRGWYDLFKYHCPHRILEEIFWLQNMKYRINASNPFHSIYRVVDASQLNAYELLFSGMKRVRDGVGHCNENQANLKAILSNDFDEPISEVTVQGLYQQCFPRYIGELAKSRGTTKFDPKKLVLSLFGSSYIT